MGTAQADAPNFGIINRALDSDQTEFLKRSFLQLKPDVTPAMAIEAKTIKISQEPKLWIARITDPSLCVAQRCLTFIIEGTKPSNWTVRAMIYAGNSLSLAEPADEPFGLGVFVLSNRPAISSDDLVTATQTPLGWLIR